MADKSATPLGLAPSTWITLSLALLGVFALKQNPFQDTRPPDSWAPVYTHSPADDQDVEARLWQDPLAAVESARDLHEPTGRSKPTKSAACRDSRAAFATEAGDAPDVHSAAHQCATVGRYRGKSPAAEVLAMGVLVSGAPYAAEIENRRRTRYAVLAGLYRSGYMPVNGEHVGYVRLAEFYDDFSHAHDVAALEWFVRDQEAAGTAPRRSRLLLLWLDQDGFRHAPITQIVKMTDSMLPPSVPLVLLGPADSDGLRAMADEVTTLDKDTATHGRVIAIYSARATASDSAIIADGTHAVAERFRDSSHHLQFQRTIATDDAVAHAVLGELAHRNVKPREIALIAERDTLYGRAMGRYFGGCVNPPRDDPGTAAPDGGPHPLCLTYLKGLDGIAPPQPKNNAGEGGGDAKLAEQPAHAAAAPESATGASQLDYLRRMAAALKAAQGSDGRYTKAIGVLSTDIYDKLLILQALRPMFPDVVFFTLDLDARFTEAGNINWSRQLVVGSSLGLALQPSLQGDIPAFRDSYQTAAFYSTMLALHRAEPGMAASAALQDSAGLQWTSHPKVFEIGRTQPFDLLIDTAQNERCTFDTDCPSISEGRTEAFRKVVTRYAASWIVLIAAASLWLLLRGALGRTLMRRPIGVRGVTLNVLTLAVAAAAEGALRVQPIWNRLWEYMTSECTRMPAPIVDGAGHWGTNLLEASLVPLVAMLLMRGQRKLNQNAVSMHDQFAFKRQPVRLMARYACRVRYWPVGRRAREWAWLPLGHLSGDEDKAPLLLGTSPLESVIAKYLFRGAWQKRVSRVLVATVVSTVGMLTLESLGFSLFGNATWFITQVKKHGWGGIIPFASLIAMQMLIFWVADALLLTRAFMLDVARDEPQWPQQTLANTRAELGLPTDLATVWLNLSLLTRRTTWVSNLIWYPSLVIAGMFAATFTIQYGQYRFESNPITLVISIGMIVAAVVLLRQSAETWRGAILQQLENRRLLCLAAHSPDKDAVASIEALIGRITALDKGAFAPYADQPLVRAVLLPALTFVGTAGLQYLQV